MVTLKNGERLSMRLRERLNRVSHVMTKDERRRFERDGWEPYTKYDFHPSGELHLEVGKAGYSWSPRREGTARGASWSRSSVRLLEGSKPSPNPTAWIASAGQRKNAFARRMHVAARRRVAFGEEEAKRFAQLRADSKHWHECRALREYLSAVELEMSARQTPEFDEWLDWARQKIDELDPLYSPPLESTK